MRAGIGVILVWLVVGPAGFGWEVRRVDGLGRRPGYLPPGGDGRGRWVPPRPSDVTRMWCATSRLGLCGVGGGAWVVVFPLVDDLLAWPVMDITRPGTIGWWFALWSIRSTTATPTN